MFVVLGVDVAPVVVDALGIVNVDEMVVVLGTDVVPVTVVVLEPVVVGEVLVILGTVVVTGVFVVTETLAPVPGNVVVEEQSGSTFEGNEPITFPGG